MKSNSPLLALACSLLCSLALTPALAADADTTASQLESQPEGWTDLLANGLNQWYRVPVPPTGALGRAHWHYDADAKRLICDGDGGHDMLLFEKEFTDHIFHFEFRYTRVEGLKGYNSGAYVRNSPGGTIWHQAQFGDNQDGFLFGVSPNANGANKFFSLKNEVKENRVKPAGEWNTMEITARGKTLTLWVNGAVTCTFKDCHQLSGFLGVEAEGYRIEFRNLKVKTLP